MRIINNKRKYEKNYENEQTKQLSVEDFSVS